MAINVDRAVGDVVAVDSYLRVDGVVRGHIFAVDSVVSLTDHSVVLGTITVNRGNLRIRPGAVLPKTISLNDADFSGPRGETIDFGQSIVLPGLTRVTLDATAVSTVSVGLMKSILPFNRFVPGPGQTVATLRHWHPEASFKLRRMVEGPKELTMGGIARLRFVSDKVRGAFQRGYRADDGIVLVTAVHLQSPDAAEALWKQVEAAGQKASLRLSMKTGLGDGAHLFFKRRNRYCMIWHNASWLMAVESRLADPNANLLDQTQFSRRVLRSLEQNLSQSSALSRGVRR